MQKIMLMAMLALTLAGCGRKGPLVPPEAMVPAPIADLSVAQQGERFVVSWTQPGREEAGGPLKDLAGFRVFRREVLPPGEDCEECPTAYRPIRTVDPEYLQDVVRVGNSFTFVDTGLETGKTYQYKVVAFKADGSESKQSNLARRKKVVPPLPPVVQATSSPTSVLLRWEPVAVAKDATLIGYRIYRKRAGSAVTQPLTGKPVTETSFEDLRLERGGTYDYTVRTVTGVDGETVESDPSAAATGRLTEPD
jgi:predicted small lipoprotein YifL/fibronectin type 3 domain-containing protein